MNTKKIQTTLLGSISCFGLLLLFQNCGDFQVISQKSTSSLSSDATTPLNDTDTGESNTQDSGEPLTSTPPEMNPEVPVQVSEENEPSSPPTTIPPQATPATDGMMNKSPRGIVDNELKAFPGAIGYARYTKGGRAPGTRIIVVDTTAEGKNSGDGKTSLQEALEATGPRIVVFKVGGIFRPAKDAEGVRRFHINSANKGNLSVFCQTAPNPGVIIETESIFIKYTKETIWRGCAINGLDESNSGGSARPFTVSGAGTDQHVFDHMSLRHGADENFLVYIGPTQKAGLKNVALTYSIITDADADSSHSTHYPGWAYHAQGPNCNSNNVAGLGRPEGCTFAYNLIAHSTGRNPGMLGAAGEVVGNIIYNGKDDMSQVRKHTPLGADVWYTNNLVKSGPQTQTIAKLEKESGININATGNYRVDRGKSISTAYSWNIDRKQSISFKQKAPVLKSIKELAQDNNYLNCLGAFIHRDDTDKNTIKEFLNTGCSSFGWPNKDPSCRDAGTIGIGQHPVSSTWFNFTTNNYAHGGSQKPAQHANPKDWNSSDQRSVIRAQYKKNTTWPDTYDTDKDGMSDEWETANGLVVGIKDGLEDKDKDGYLNIEEFANSLLRCKTGW